MWSIAKDLLVGTARAELARKRAAASEKRILAKRGGWQERSEWLAVVEGSGYELVDRIFEAFCTRVDGIYICN